jgi:hypothetical protein
MEKKRKVMWEPTRTIIIVEEKLSENIDCILGGSDKCLNTKKCNRKNICNESIKDFFNK